MLWSVFIIVVILWALGFAFDVAGGFVHILLVIALISLIYNLIVGRRSR